MAELLEFEDPIISPVYWKEIESINDYFSKIRNDLYFISKAYNREVSRFPYFDNILRLVIEFKGDSKLIIDSSGYTTENIEGNHNEYEVDIYDIMSQPNKGRYSNISYILSKFRDMYSLNCSH